MQVAKRYAQALYEIAAEQKKEAAVKEELLALTEVFLENPDLFKLLTSPSFAKTQQDAIFAEIFADRLNEHLYNLVRLLIRNRSVKILRELYNEYKTMYNEQFGIVEAVVLTAVPLSGPVKERLARQLETQTGKTVAIEYKVDPSIIGGLSIDMGNTQIDATVRQRLELLRRDIAQTIA